MISPSEAAAQALALKVLSTPRPAWSLRAVYRGGALVGVIPAGLAATPEEAVEWYRRYRGLPGDPVRVLAFPRTAGRP